MRDGMPCGPIQYQDRVALKVRNSSIFDFEHGKPWLAGGVDHQSCKGLIFILLLLLHVRVGKRDIYSQSNLRPICAMYTPH